MLNLSPQQVNRLRDLLASGGISPTDLEQIQRENVTASIGGGQEQPLMDLLRPQRSPLPMGSMRNENTGEMTYFNPKPQQMRAQGEQGFSDQPYQQPLPTQGATAYADRLKEQMPKMKVYGVDNGQVIELGEEFARAIPVDYSRGGIEVPGLGKALYSRDGRYAIGTDANGQPFKAVLGYDEQASQRRNSIALAQDKVRAEAEQSREAVARSQQERTTREGMPGMGVPQSVLEKQFGKAPDGNRWTTQGQLEKIPGYEDGAKLTESQSNAYTYGARAAEASQIMDIVGEGGKVQPGVIARGAEAVPVVGGALRMATNWTQSEKQQQVDQAQRNFINAILRRESGAVISPGEFANAALQYFPQPSDEPAVVWQKKRNRESAIEGLATGSGPMRSKVFGAGQKAKAIFEAQAAIRQGADPVKVRERLLAAGITDSGL